VVLEWQVSKTAVSCRTFYFETILYVQ
jgi:hypothetical protein